MPGLADATTIPVDSTLDTTGGGICTLRDAINAANANSGFGTCPAGQPSPTVDTIDLKAVGGPTIMLTADLPLISSNLDIVGPGSALLAVDGAGLHRPFRSTSGSITDSISGLTITHGFCDTSCPGGAAGAGIFSSGTLTLTDVTVNNNTTSATGGANAFPEGGGILNNGGTVHLVLSTVTGNIASATNATSQNGPNGGGIFNNGTLTLDRSTVAANQAMANAGGVGTNAGANGGGIDHFSGTLTISRSTIIGNSVTASGASVANSAHGGGIGMANAASIALTLDRSTVTGNSVSAGSPASSQGGGGIDANGFTGSSVAVISSTISGNSAPAGAANLVPAGATRSIKNSIVSNPLGGGVNCSSTNTGSLGFNIESANSCGFNQAGDQPNTDPILDIPNGNGGPTRTMALLAGSPAIDAGLSSVGESVDQRGLSRPSDFLDIANGPGGDGTDIGAGRDAAGYDGARDLSQRASSQAQAQGDFHLWRHRAGRDLQVQAGQVGVRALHLSGDRQAPASREAQVLGGGPGCSGQRGPDPGDVQVQAEALEIQPTAAVAAESIERALKMCFPGRPGR